MRHERGLSLANLVQRAKLAGHSIGKAYVSQVEVVAKSDPASLRDGDGAVLDVAGAYAIKLLRVRGGQRWLEEHRAGHEPRRVEFQEARIIGRVVEVTSPWARR